MTKEQLVAKSLEIDKRLDDVGLGGEYPTIFGFVLGTAARKFGGWDKLDGFLLEYTALMKEAMAQYALEITIGNKPPNT